MIHGSNYNFVDYTPGSTVIEGIATERISANLRWSLPSIDGAFIGSDREAIEMAYFLKEYEGLIVGSSAALNLVGAVKAAQKLGPGKTIVTVICDTGVRYMSKLYNPEYLKEKKLEPKFYKEGQHHLSFIEPLTDKTFCYKAKNWNGKL